MPKNFKILFLVVSLQCCFNLFAQNKGNFKDVELDGKPAKLNIKTGEVILINTLNLQPSNPVSKVGYKNQTEQKSDSTKLNNQSDYHIVREGETLLDLSNKYKVTLRNLKKANGLESTLVDVGQQLRVKNFDKANDTIISEVGLKIYPSKKQVHIVRRGETLFGISKLYNNSVDSIKELNGLNSDLIYLGQELYYNTNDNREISSLTSNKLKDVPNIHIVEKNETLYGLSKQYDLDIETLKRYNDLSSNTIIVGQRLRLADLNEFIELNKEWVVSKGDTLYNIAKRNGTTINTIKNLNHLTGDLIKIGQKLRLR